MMMIDPERERQKWKDEIVERCVQPARNYSLRVISTWIDLLSAFGKNKKRAVGLS